MVDRESYEPYEAFESYEAVADEDLEESEAYTVDYDGGADTEVDRIESVVGDVVDGDVAVVLPNVGSHGSLGRGTVDGQDMEALFDAESRDLESIEDDYSVEHGEPPDLVELTERHLDEE